MVSLQILKLAPCPLSSRSNDFGSSKAELRRRVHDFAISSKYYFRNRLRVHCAAQDGDSQGKGEEPPESLFMKELRRRGMNPTSLLEDYEVDDGIKTEEGTRNASTKSGGPPNIDPSLANQRERSMALNSEGLEGLFPRAKLLLTIGGTFFLGFWPLIIITVTFFCALYLIFGQDFIHDAGKTPISPPQYVDPYALLEDEQMSEIIPPI